MTNNMGEIGDLTTAANGSGPAGNHSTEGLSYILPWWQQACFYTIFVIIFVMAAGGNIIVIWIVLAHKRMRTVTNYFLVNLAIADVLISIFNLPFHLTFNMYQIWFFGLEYCKINFFIAPLTISVSVFTFMAIAIDRYIAIIHPLRPRLTGRIVLSIISVIWILSFFLALPNLLFATTCPIEGGRVVCWVEWPDSSEVHPSKQDFAYNIILMILNYFLPIITLSATYVRIGWELWGSKVIGETVPMQADRVKSKRKVVKMMIAVVVIFGLCWLPTHIYFILTSIFTDIVYWTYIQQVYLLIYWLAMSNSMYNPIIYCLMNARFRAGFKSFFSIIFRCGVCQPDMNLLRKTNTEW
ncbi:hypothetical protein RRG08_067287 [Elysia crispata]|uniref:G-protein coupled receptors family 1 profile domain-containing protein n=1 Tax=Elysia crispata TaxID=231223 RepID=A0AAE0ZAE9_9GAST|nr:hypothetical protein RRG08_067287 [Elysia crispata]